MADADPYADLLEEDPYADLLAKAPQELAPPAKDKALPMSPLAATLKAYGATPQGSLARWALEKLGATAQPIQRAGATEVGGGETFLNKAVNMVPAGGVATDLGAAGSFLLAQKAGKVAPDAARMLSGLTGRLLPESLQIGPVPGPGAVLTPQALKELAAIGVDTKEPETGAVETYRRLRDVRRTRTEAGEEQNPLAALGGTAGGIGLGLLAPLPKFTPKGGAAATTGAKILAGARTGAAYGGLAGLTSGDADTAGGDFTGTALQGAFGLGLGSILGGAAPAAGAFGNRLIRGVVRPTPAAQALQQEGVEGLTLGQMDPKSALGAIEGTAQATPGIGTVLQGQRERAVDSLRSVALSRAVAPGATPPPAKAPIPEAIAHLRKGFDATYDAIRDAKVPTRGIDRMLVAADDPNIITTDAERIGVAKFLQNQLSVLPPSGTETTAGVLMKVRSNIRDAIFKATQGGNMDRAALLQRAEEELTKGLNDGLPEAAAKTLRATDAQYRTFKIVQDAAASAGDTASGPGMFTPKGLSSAVDRGTGETSYAEGGGGPLRALTSAAAQAFADPPKTGWSALGGPWVRGVTGPLLIAANRPGVQPFMLGQAPIQQSARAVESALQRYLSRLNTSPQTLAPQALFEAMRGPPQENP